ncbi:MAG: NAD(P)/FAD-dependent oxidoreductase [Phormidesmis sp.]
MSVRALSPHICIIGGGFGGLYSALYLQKYRHLRQCRITLIEPKERFLFTPMMYELITGELKDWEIAPTYSSLVAAHPNIQWQQAHATSVDMDTQTVVLSNDSSHTYDYLVIARGADNRPVDIPGVEDYALTFRSLEDTHTLRARLAQLVQAHSQPLQSLSSENQPVHVVVVGGGPSGVELASKVSDYLRERHIPYLTMLLERGNAILKPFAPGLKKVSQRSLLRRNITVLTNTAVQAVEPDAVTVEQDNQTHTISSDLTLWAVGTQPKPWLGVQSVGHNQQGQRLTRRSLQLISYDNVFVLGDGADIRGPKQDPAPNTAQAAFQGASQVAANLARMTRGKPPKPFNYLHLGDMITLGIGEAGLHSFGLTLGGKFAGLCRRGVYIFRMPTRRHQMKVARRALRELVRAVFKPLFKPVSKLSNFL